MKKIRGFEHNSRIGGRVTVKLKVLKVFYLKNKLGAKKGGQDKHDYIGIWRSIRHQQ